MLNRTNYKYFIRSVLFSVIFSCIFFFKSQIAWSQYTKPKAVVMGLNTTTTPIVSEQILLQALRDKLENNFDLSSQSAFEKSIREKSLADADSKCRLLKCILDVHKNFPRTNLFLLKSSKNGTRITLTMIEGNHKWLVKHELCSSCGFSKEEMVKNLVIVMQGYFTNPLSILGINSPKSHNSQTMSVPKKNSKTKQLSYSDHLLRLKDTIQKKKKVRLPLEEFKYKLAQKQYNNLIGKRIKRDLMFFRHKKRQKNLENLKAQLRLQINQSGKVIDRMLIRTSGSNMFDKMVLDAVDLLKLPPPMELLIREPPYVVTILIKP